MAVSYILLLQLSVFALWLVSQVLLLHCLRAELILSLYHFQWIIHHRSISNSLVLPAY
jgi:hypothetical protein